MMEWDKALARGADQDRQAKPAPGVEPGDANQALLRRLAKADAGIEHDALAGNTGTGGNGERAFEERGDVGDDVDPRIGGIAIVHDDDGASCAATTWAMSGSRCSPHTSLTIVAPASSAQAAMTAFIVSMETGMPSPITAGRMGGETRAFLVERHGNRIAIGS